MRFFVVDISHAALGVKHEMEIAVADEQTVDQVETPTEDGTTPAAEPPKTETETPVEHMIPKARFDEINNQLKALKAEQAKAAKEREQAERKAAEEQGEYKKLYERMQAEKQAAEAEAKELRLAQMRQAAVRKATEKDAWARPTLEKWTDRLRGETEDELVEDALAMLATIPKPTAPNINAGAGDGNVNQAGIVDEAEKKEFAAIYGVDPRYIQ